ncbi:MAG: FAD-dependent hydroxylase [Alkalinema sp. RL_2_19]|nr:FAD-dependent hydroxylase [Alkalinema sp. RL_2_19]
MQNNFLDYDVTIVGGGIVGTLTACLLESTGLKVALLEFSPISVAAARGQAYSISQLSSRIFAGLGLWHKIRPQIETYNRVQLSDADSPSIVKFSPQDTQTQTLGYVAEHQVLLTELQTKLKQCRNVDWLCPAKVVDVQFGTDVQFGAAANQLTVERGNEVRQIRSRLIIGADGSRSFLRQAAGIKTIGWKYWQSCVVAFIKPEKPHNHTAYERFQPEGPFAILPLPGGVCRIVWTAPKTEADRLLQIDPATFLQELTQRYGDQMGQLELLGERSIFPVQLLHSRQYVKPGLALIGDAAHCCHPVGGQGINLGIRDAAALAEVITTALERDEDFAALPVLKRYQRWRMWENLVMLGFTDILDRTFSNTILPIVWVRRWGLWAMEHVPPLKSFAIKLMLGMIGRVPKIAAREPIEQPLTPNPEFAMATDSHH